MILSKKISQKTVHRMAKLHFWIPFDAGAQNLSKIRASNGQSAFLDTT
jgi:hypothetical protein